MDHLDKIVVSARTRWWGVRDGRLRPGEVGEGVISAAIAVLIVAGIGALAWVAFNGLFTNASNKAAAKVNEIGG